LMETRVDARLSEIGEKTLIRELISPMFNPNCEVMGVGDDCAMVPCGCDYLLLSTDRVPADLISFKIGLLDYAGLGAYLVNLNLSDIAACGGIPIGLLLNLGLPDSMLLGDLQSLCSGALNAAMAQSAEILGGDLSSSSELSISATSFGRVLKHQVLTRRSARPGDIVVASRPLGLTPAAFAYFLHLRPKGFRVAGSDEDQLVEQFKLPPLISLGRALAESGLCTSCMDNTDGLGQTLSELSEFSRVSVVLECESLDIPPLVERIASELEVEPVQLAFRAGADFSLIGTLSERPTSDLAMSRVKMIGHCEEATGVFLDRSGSRTRVQAEGWNYFSQQTGAK
jgi:thiamine-monophosphate kinase